MISSNKKHNLNFQFTVQEHSASIDLHNVSNKDFEDSSTDANTTNPSSCFECSCEHSSLNCPKQNFLRKESYSSKNMSFDEINKKDQISFGRRRHQFKSHREANFFSKHSPFNEMHTLKEKKKRKAAKFRYGNYHQYYGYRNPDCVDSRLSCMKKEWFYSKDVLDLGCNVGHLTLSIARDFSPHSIVGLDIDEELVKVAKRNVRHYIDYSILSDDEFPLSLALCYGPVAQSLDPKCRYSAASFPFNIQFIQGNYILPSDEALEWQEQFFDTILCFSLTKWIHLNWGDEGVKRLFHRAYAQLHPGGYFLLEAQAFQSYAKRKKITEEILKHFNAIQFYPEMFNEYLLKEVGFKSCELVDTPAHSSKGFSRPIYLFIKGELPESQMKPKHVFYDSDSEHSCNYSDVEQFSD